MSVSLRDRAYNYIRSQLINGQFPPGSRLSHRALAKEIGISFIPVREAVSQLVSEGLVVHEPKLGSFVMQVSRQELAELYDLREALESHAVLKATGSIGQADLDEMQRSNDQMVAIAQEVSRLGPSAWSGEQIDRWMLSDAVFHVVLLRAAGNSRALKTVSDLRLMTHVFGHHNDSRSLGDLERVCQEHEQLLDALRRGKASQAQQVLVRHLRAGCELALAAYDRRRMQEDNRQDAGQTYLDTLREKIHAIERDSAPPVRSKSKSTESRPKGKPRDSRR
jgi:DNA-binding GntR family transcriptional regulator